MTSVSRITMRLGPFGLLFRACGVPISATVLHGLLEVRVVQEGADHRLPPDSVRLLLNDLSQQFHLCLDGGEPIFQATCGHDNPPVLNLVGLYHPTPASAAIT